MKFGRRLQEEAFEEFEPHYIAYKELKKAIKLITGSDTSQFTISEVTSNFGNIPALAGSTYRPPESRFQDLLNFEVEKINKFSALIYSSISSNLQAALKTLYHGEVSTLEALDSLREATETSADGVAYLHSYTRLNFIGFRKITKKYDKHNKSAASGFYLARLVKEPFVNLNFDFLVELISIVFGEMRRMKRILLIRLEKSLTTTESQPPQQQQSSSASNDDSDEDAAVDYDEDDIDLDDDSTATRVTATEASGTTTTSSHPLEMTNTTYLIGESDLMRVRVHLAKHIPLTSLGSIMCPKPSRDIVKAFVSGIPEHHQQGSTCVTIEGPQGGPVKQQTLPKCARVNTNLMLDSSGNFVNPAIYRFEQNRVSAGCLYFDNSELEVYRQLLSPQVDESKAEVLRLRWIPEQQTTSNANRLSTTAVLEIVKAFQPAESPNEWQDVTVVNEEQNVSNAVVLKRSQIPDLLNGKSSIDAIISDLQLQPSAVPQVKSVLERALTTIQDKHCAPIFQEWFHRSHFRKSGSKVTRRVFAHLDESIRFTDALQCIERDPSFSSFWIAPHLSQFIIDKDVHTCPFGVLTISLAGNTKPKFLPKITGLTTVSEVWRYAPQLHGVPLFKRAELGSSDLPHWFQFVTTDVEESKNSATPKEKKESKQQREEATSSDGNNVLRVDVVSSKPGSRLLHEHAVTLQQQQQQQQQDVATGEDRRLSATLTRQQSLTPGRTSRGLSALNEPLLSSVNVPITPEITPEQSQPSLYQAVTPPRAGSSARTPLLIASDQSAYPQESLISQFIRGVSSFIPQRPSWLSLTGDSSRSALVGSAAVRVEPKTFFANERTLLQWMNTAVLLSTISITLLNFGTPTGRLAGLIMAPVALFFIIYSFLVYLRRSHSLEKKEPINYNDRVGPAILVLCLICALSAIILLNIIYGPANDYASSSSNADSAVMDASKTASYGSNIPMPHPTSSDFLAVSHQVI